MLNYELVKNELALKSWCLQDSVLPQDICHSLVELFQKKIQSNDFQVASVGKDSQKVLEERIRSSETCWIEEWDESPELQKLYSILQSLMEEIKNHFFISLKRFESQLAYYPDGGFYKKHLDQLRGGNHRQLTCIFYLNDCEKGGELVVYSRDNRNEKAATVNPLAGNAVIFFSSQIYHEVLPAHSPRYSLTTWFRDDHIL